MATQLEESSPEIVQWNERRAQSIRESPPTSASVEPQDAKKQQLLDLLASLLRRGRLTPEEIAGTVGRSLPPGSLEQLKTAQGRLSDLQAELRLEHATNEFLDGEVTRLKVALSGEHELVKEGLYRIATLERKLQEAQETTTKLVIASRDSLRTLRRVGTDLNDEGFEAYVLEPLARDVCRVARTVQELHSVARGKDASPPKDLENP